MVGAISFLAVSRSDSEAKVIPNTLPNLRSISFTREEGCAESLKALESLSQLEDIELHEPAWHHYLPPVPQSAELEAAKKVLRSCAKLSGQAREVVCAIRSIVAFDANIDDEDRDLVSNKGTCSVIYLR